MGAPTLLAGSYERFLFGFKCSVSGRDDVGDGATAKLERCFTYPAHQAAVKCIAAAGRFLASGGVDDQIHLYDLQNGKDLGFLMNPCNGAVSTATFYTPPGTSRPTHLLTGSSDGGVCVWKAGGAWDALQQLKGHCREVTGLSVHSSGAVALSVARDRSLRLWNLVKGRSNYSVKLEAEPGDVAFEPATGQTFALVAGARVTVHDVERREGLVATLQLPRVPLALAWADAHSVLVGCEGGALRCYDTRAPAAPAWALDSAHRVRVKGVCLAGVEGLEGADAVGSASSDGVVRLWDPRRLAGSDGAAQPLAEAATGARFTCLAGVRAAPAGAAAIAPSGAGRAAAAAVGGGGGDGVARAASSKKRKAEERAAARRAAEVEAAARGGQHRPAEVSPSGDISAKARGKGKAGAGGTRGRADAQDAVAEDGVVVRDGVVEFVDDKAAAAQQQLLQKRRVRKLKQRAKVAREAGGKQARTQ